MPTVIPSPGREYALCNMSTTCHVAMSTCRVVAMPVIAIISQKGGAGKTTLAIHLAAAAQDAGRVALIIDTDPQATASQWAAWRGDMPPEVIDSPPPRLASKVTAAQEQGAELIVIDTPPHANSAARAPRSRSPT